MGEFIVEGVGTNIDFQYEIICNEDYKNGNVDTGFIERLMADKKR